MAHVEFRDFSTQVINALDDGVIAFLEEAGSSLQEQAADNTRRKTGDTAAKWNYIVDDSAKECTIGNPLQNAIWEEFGTGEYAYYRNGRRGGWHYKGDDGKWHHTYGKTPTRALHNAYVVLKPAIINKAKQIFKARMG